MTEPLQIRITPIRHPQLSTISQSQSIPDSDKRYAFWAPLREIEQFSNQSIEQFEAKLTFEFGHKLHNRLVESVKDEIREFEQGLFGREFSGDIFKFLDHEFHFMRREKGGWPYSWADPFVKYFELRQHALTEVPQFRANLERLSAAAAVRFSTRIRGYGSLNMEVTVGAIERLSKVFDDNFDNFRVFLDCFVPVAFAEVFDTSFAEQMSYDVMASNALEKTFHKAASKRVNVGTPTANPMHQSTPTPIQRDSLKKAEYLWRLANGSLLIPFLLALAVFYFGFREFSSLRTAQYEALKPILEHQLLLLKEDRERLAAEHIVSMQRSPTPPPHSPP